MYFLSTLHLLQKMLISFTEGCLWNGGELPLFHLSWMESLRQSYMSTTLVSKGQQNCPVKYIHQYQLLFTSKSINSSLYLMKFKLLTIDVAIKPLHHRDWRSDGRFIYMYRIKASDGWLDFHWTTLNMSNIKEGTFNYQFPKSLVGLSWKSLTQSSTWRLLLL